MKRVLAITMLAGVLAPVVLGSACAPEEIVLATLPPSPDGGGKVDPRRCATASDCSASSFCERHDCADPVGTCEARPVVCDDDARPVCGCDGITYWNDCLRRAAGITAKVDGECTTSAQTCGHDGPPGPGPMPPINTCPANTFCARLLPPAPPLDPCPPDAPGTCWALPAVCSGGRPGPDRWTPCAPGMGACVTTCDAIRTGLPHRRASACP
jgi:hypothetical protein